MTKQPVKQDNEPTVLELAVCIPVVLIGTALYSVVMALWRYCKFIIRRPFAAFAATCVGIFWILVAIMWLLALQSAGSQ